MARKLSTLPPRLGTLDTRRLKPEPKRADTELLTAQYRQWRAEVMRRAGYQCQHVEHGRRCPKRSPEHRLFADHIKERKDGGSLLDPANGQAFCGEHHTIKTMKARSERR